MGKKKRHNNQYFIAKATSQHKGSFHKWCQKHGHKKADAACIAHALRVGNTHVQHKARLAKNLAAIRPK
jgi:hypothetical protein